MRKSQMRLKRNLSQRVNRVDAFIGDPGIGKTITARVVAARMGWKCRVFHFANQSFEDITGLPIIEEQEGPSGTQKVATFAKSAAVPGAVWETYDDDSQGMLGVIDDGHRTPPVQQGQLVELIDGRLNGEPIDPRCVLIFTGNPPDPAIVTGQMIDAALEDRLNVHIVMPTREELLDIWSKIMPEKVYQFLVMNPGVIPTISARAWMGVAYDVQDVLDSGASPSEAVSDVVGEFSDNAAIEQLLRKFLKFGDDPFYYPILGRNVLAADSKQMQHYMQIMTRWFKENQRGLVGESKSDLVRALNMLTEEEFGDDAQRGRMAQNICDFMTLLINGECNDMAQQLMKTTYASALCGPVVDRMENEPALESLLQTYSRYEQRKHSLGEGSAA